MKITKQTVVAAALLLLGIVNEVLTAFGKSPLPFKNETVTDLISLIFLGVSSFLALKSGKEITPTARLSKRLSEALKKGYISEEKAEAFFTEIEDGELSETEEREEAKSDADR